MTIQSFSFLRQLKRAQIVENGAIMIDDMNEMIRTAPGANGGKVQIRLDKKWTSIDPMLEYLESYGFIARIGEDEIRVTHAGWHYCQSKLADIQSIIALLVSILALAVSILANYSNIIEAIQELISRP